MHHPERSGARGLKTLLLFTISHFYIMFYNHYFEISEIGRLLSCFVRGDFVTVYNGNKVMRDEFLGIITFPKTYSVEVSDTGCWID